MTFKQIFDRNAPMSWWAFVFGWMIGIYILIRMPKEPLLEAAAIYIPLTAAIVVEYVIRTGRYLCNLVGGRR